MTTLATSLRNLPLEGFSGTTESIFLSGSRETDGGSFLDALDRAGASEMHTASRDNRVSDSPTSLSDQIDAGRTSRADNESSTPTHGGRTDRIEPGDTSIGESGANVGGDEDASSTVVVDAGSAQDSAEQAQEIPENDIGQNPLVSAEAGVPANVEIVQIAASTSGQVAPARQNDSRMIEPSTSMLGTTTLQAVGTDVVEQATATNNGQRSDVNGPTMQAGQNGATVVTAASGDTDRLPNGQHSSEAARASTVLPGQVERMPDTIDSADPLRLDASNQRAGTAMQTNADAGNSSEGEDGNPGQPNFTATGATAAESRAQQLETALRLEQATGQPATTELGARTSGTTTSSMPTLGNLTDLTSGLGAMKSDQSEASIDGRFTNRLVRGLSAMINQRGGVMTMRLDPPDLGELRIQMSLSRGVVTAQFEASNPQAHDMINKHLSTLRSALETQGLTVERLQAQAPPSASSQGTPEESAGDQSHGDHQGEHEAHLQQDDSSSRDETPDEATVDSMSADVKGAEPV